MSSRCLAYKKGGEHLEGGCHVQDIFWYIYEREASQVHPCRGQVRFIHAVGKSGSSMQWVLHFVGKKFSHKMLDSEI